VLEVSIKDLQLIDPLDGLAGIRHQQLKYFESERNKILLADEALWRQRCRAKWIQCGDLNNKYFHRYARIPGTINIYGISWMNQALYTVDNKLLRMQLLASLKLSTRQSHNPLYRNRSMWLNSSLARSL
jgi:hypothetical protein